MALKAIKPEIIKPTKPKAILSGPAGVGKTYFSLNFPAVYYIDTEGGATREPYVKKLIASGGVYMGKEQGSQDFKTVIEQIKELATTDHPYKTLCIDSFSKLYNLTAAIAEDTVGTDYGRDKREANKPTRQLVRWIDKVDMTVWLICHQKDKWVTKGGASDRSRVGTTFDAWEKLEYELDLWLEASQVGKERLMTVKKTRIETFPLGAEFPLDYQMFCKLYGKDLVESQATPIKVATAEQVAEVKSLLDRIKIDPNEVEKWLSKADVDDWSEMAEEQIKKVLDFLNKKLGGK